MCLGVPKQHPKPGIARVVSGIRNENHAVMGMLAIKPGSSLPGAGKVEHKWPRAAERFVQGVAEASMTSGIQLRRRRASRFCVLSPSKLMAASASSDRSRSVNVLTLKTP